MCTFYIQRHIKFLSNYRNHKKNIFITEIKTNFGNIKFNIIALSLYYDQRYDFAV